MNHRFKHICERSGVGRLGRHIEWDERSRCFMAMAAPPGPLVSVQWTRHCDPFDQGELGSCTGNAMAGALMTGPLYSPQRAFTESDAVYLYEQATLLDRIPGHYPPNDTGSSGLAVAKAAKRARWIAQYHHAFGLSAALSALSRGPVIIGVNWYEGFDAPVGDQAELRIEGEVRGGHEIVLDGLDVDEGMVHGTNSWGLGWGNQGTFTMSFGTFGRLLKEDGDVVVPLAA